MKKVIPIIIFSFIVCCFSQSNAQDMKKLIDENFEFAVKQYKVLAKNTPADKMPRTYEAKEDKFVYSDLDWWTSGFYPGTLWYIYEQTKNNEIKAEAERRLTVLERQKRYTGNHDIGFMIFCSFGNALRITGNEAYRPTIDTAAMTLLLRYRPYVQGIQSWNTSRAFGCPIIIDNMMNLELLCWVSDRTNRPIFRDIAIEHANVTMRDHYRPDYSSYHAVDYDINTGKVLKKVTWQGLKDESAWARGQAWGLYGFTMMYRMVKDPRYLEQAKNISEFLINHPNLPADGVPYWDFNDPEIPNALRDVSAASIIASALLELGQLAPENQKKYVAKAELILRSLSSDKYRAKYGENGGFILMHSVGSIPHKSEIDVPLTYADYYFIEALLRYKNWYLK